MKICQGFEGYFFIDHFATSNITSKKTDDLITVQKKKLTIIEMPGDRISKVKIEFLADSPPKSTQVPEIK